MKGILAYTMEDLGKVRGPEGDEWVTRFKVVGPNGRSVETLSSVPCEERGDPLDIKERIRRDYEYLAGILVQVMRPAS